MTAVVVVVVVEVGSRGGNRVKEVWEGGAGVEKYNFSSSIAVSVITACHA